MSRPLAPCCRTTSSVLGSNSASPVQARNKETWGIRKYGISFVIAASIERRDGEIVFEELCATSRFCD